MRPFHILRRVVLSLGGGLASGALASAFRFGGFRFCEEAQVVLGIGVGLILLAASGSARQSGAGK